MLLQLDTSPLLLLPLLLLRFLSLLEEVMGGRGVIEDEEEEKESGRSTIAVGGIEGKEVEEGEVGKEGVMKKSITTIC